MNLTSTEQPHPQPAAHHRRRINWRQEYLYVTVALMTACWLAGWLALSLSWFLTISLATTLGVCAVNLLASVLLVRWMIHRRIQPGQQTVNILLLMWVAAGLTTLATPWLATTYGTGQHLTLRDMFYIDRQARVPAGPLMVLWVLFLWWRGSAMASAYMSLVRTAFGMRLGILSFLLLMLSVGSTRRTELLSLVPIFFFLGLISSSLARADSLGLDRSGRATTFGRGWIISLLTVSISVTLGGYVLALWMSGMDLNRAGNALTTLGEGILTLLFVVFTPILFLGQVVYNGLNRLLPDEMPGTILDNSASGSSGQSGGIDAPWLANLISLFTQGFMVIIVVFIVFLLLAFVWFVIFARSERTVEDEEHELLGTGEVIGGLRQALRDNWRRLTDAFGLLRDFGPGRSFLAALTIRRIYARMERLAAARGYPRSAAQTPYEYRLPLFQAYPDLNADIEHITEAYIAVRYGEIPEDPAALDSVRAAWDRLRHSPDPTKTQ